MVGSRPFVLAAVLAVAASGLLVGLAVWGGPGGAGGKAAKDDETEAGIGRPLDTTDPEADIPRVLEAFQDSTFRHDGNGLSVIDVTYNRTDAPQDAYVTVEYGLDDALRVDVDAHFVTRINAILYCTKDSMVLVAQRDSRVARPMRDEDHNCLKELPFMRETPLPTEEELAGMRRTQIYDHGNDTTSVVYEGEGGQEVLVTVDGEGRLLRMRIKDPASFMDVTASYGTKRAIGVPSGFQRMPAYVRLEPMPEPSLGLIHWNVGDAPQEPLLSELELRVRDRESLELVAAFKLNRPGTQRDAGLVFLMDDADHDDRLSEDDTFRVQGPSEGFPDGYEFQLYDLWADAPTDSDNPLPSPGLALALVPLAVMAWLRRRKA